MGNLESIQFRRMLSYDHERVTSRKGIRAIPGDERADMLTSVGMHRVASIDIAEREIAENRWAAAVDDDLAVLAPEVGLMDLWT